MDGGQPAQVSAASRNMNWARKTSRISFPATGHRRHDNTHKLPTYTNTTTDISLMPVVISLRQDALLRMLTAGLYHGKRPTS